MKHLAVFPQLKFLGVLSGLVLLLSGNLRGQEILSPPFGLNWGDSPEKLVSWATARSMDITITLPGGKPALRHIRVTPTKGLLPDSTASSVEGKFLNGGLFELTVHYLDSYTSPKTMEERFRAKKAELSREHGSFALNQQRKSVEDQFVTRTKSFHHESLKGVFLLIAWTEVEDLLRKTKVSRFSLIYRNDNYKSELESRSFGE